MSENALLCMEGTFYSIMVWSKLNFTSQGTTLTFAATCPVGQVRFNFHLPYSNFHLPLKNSMFYNISFKPNRTWFWHVKAYFLGQAWMPLTTNLHTYTKSKPKIYKVYFPSGASKMQFSLAPQLYFTNSTCPGQWGKHQCRALHLIDYP